MYSRRPHGAKGDERSGIWEDFMIKRKEESTNHKREMDVKDLSSLATNGDNKGKLKGDYFSVN